MFKEFQTTFRASVFMFFLHFFTFFDSSSFLYEQVLAFGCVAGNFSTDRRPVRLCNLKRKARNEQQQPKNQLIRSDIRIFFQPEPLFQSFRYTQAMTWASSASELDNVFCIMMTQFRCRWWLKLSGIFSTLLLRKKSERIQEDVDAQIIIETMIILISWNFIIIFSDEELAASS